LEAYQITPEEANPIYRRTKSQTPRLLIPKEDEAPLHLGSYSCHKRRDLNRRVKYAMPSSKDAHIHKRWLLLYVTTWDMQYPSRTQRCMKGSNLISVASDVTHIKSFARLYCCACHYRTKPKATTNTLGQSPESLNSILLPSLHRRL